MDATKIRSISRRFLLVIRGMILSFFLFYKRVVIDVGDAYHLNMEGYFTCMKVNPWLI